MIIEETPEALRIIKNFIGVWQHSETIDEVAASCGINKFAAYRYRRELDVRLGVRLKDLERTRPPKLSAAAVAVLKQHADSELLHYLNSREPKP